MSLMDTFQSGAAFQPPGGASTLDLDSQLAEQRREHRRIYLQQRIAYWWHRVLLFIVAAMASAIIGEYLPGNVRTVLCGLVVVAAFIVALKNLQAGFLLTAIISTAWLPKVTAFGTLDIYPSLILIVLLFWLLVVRFAFHTLKPFFPSFWTIWPQIGLITVAVIAEIAIQFTWITGVSHDLAHRYSSIIISNPVWQDETLGIWMYTLPITFVLITTTIINKHDRWIEYFQRAIMFLGVVGSGIIIYEFRRKGVSVDVFRTAEPSILWMTLRSLSQLLVQASLIAYARFLYATNIRSRISHGLMIVFCLIGVYLSLQNSWWVEVAVGMVAMTIIYSRRLITACVAIVLPLTPLIYAYLNRLQSVKKDDINRITIWHDAFWAWTRRPVLGFGPGNYWVYDQAFTTLARNLRDFTLTGLGVAHDGYLQVLVETGPLGEFFYIASIVVIAIASYRLFKRYPIARKKYFGLLGFIDLGLAIDPHAPRQSEGRRARLDLIVLLKNKLKGWRATSKGLMRTHGYVNNEVRDYLRDGLVRLWVLFWGMDTNEDLERRRNCMLGLCAFGLILGSAFGDLTTSSFFLPARQLNQFVETPQVIVSWMIWGFVLYKDRVWRIARKKARYGVLSGASQVSPVEQ
jgi:O-Antigen ligase